LGKVRKMKREKDDRERDRQTERTCAHSGRSSRPSFKLPVR
jgi:hypothetical protein